MEPLPVQLHRGHHHSAAASDTTTGGGHPMRAIAGSSAIGQFGDAKLGRGALCWVAGSRFSPGVGPVPRTGDLFSIVATDRERLPQPD
jgi:hypothetical protein